ncbi:MAG: sulfur carrier protein ThiS [Bacteroidetes bacterium]|nr:sulfur carrier protein ThiS [Bacteroidota bacterium]
MNIIVNNNPETIEGDTITVNQLLQLKNFTFRMLIVKINGTLVQKGDYETAAIHDADDVSVLHLISGG